MSAGRPFWEASTSFSPLTVAEAELRDLAERYDKHIEAEFQNLQTGLENFRERYRGELKNFYEQRTRILEQFGTSFSSGMAQLAQANIVPSLSRSSLIPAVDDLLEQFNPTGNDRAGAGTAAIATESVSYCQAEVVDSACAGPLSVIKVDQQTQTEPFQNRAETADENEEEPVLLGSQHQQENHWEIAAKAVKFLEQPPISIQQVPSTERMPVSSPLHDMSRLSGLNAPAKPQGSSESDPQNQLHLQAPDHTPQQIPEATVGKPSEESREWSRTRIDLKTRKDSGANEPSARPQKRIRPTTVEQSVPPPVLKAPTIRDVAGTSLTRYSLDMLEVYGMEGVLEYPQGSNNYCVIRCDLCPAIRFKSSSGQKQGVVKHWRGSRYGPQHKVLPWEDILKYHTHRVPGADSSWADDSNNQLYIRKMTERNNKLRGAKETITVQVPPGWGQPNSISKSLEQPRSDNDIAPYRRPLDQQTRANPDDPGPATHTDESRSTGILEALDRADLWSASALDFSVGYYTTIKMEPRGSSEESR
ncbi:hypothetical protein BJ170DRAFT_689973 [Xylariales sp. AK1849]|nr:hypothetical protein BJ170DRAFT_689973 [Xylariales sp. AK1849]